MWEVGDVIGSCIDLDNGTITFYRNGKSLGVAFNTVRIKEKGLAYFPTISLSNREKLFCNFGDFPLEYPIKGYQALQYPNFNINNNNNNYYYYSFSLSIFGKSNYFCRKMEKFLIFYPLFDLGKEDIENINENVKEDLNNYLHLFYLILEGFLPLIVNENSAVVPFVHFLLNLSSNNFHLIFNLFNTILEVFFCFFLFILINFNSYFYYLCYYFSHVLF